MTGGKRQLSTSLYANFANHTRLSDCLLKVSNMHLPRI